jgi:hypothetical protein
VIIREAMTMDIANVVEDYGSLLAWGWAQHAAHLLEVQAEGLRGPEQDGATGGGDVTRICTVPASNSATTPSRSGVLPRSVAAAIQAALNDAATWLA